VEPVEPAGREDRGDHAWAPIVWRRPLNLTFLLALDAAIEAARAGEQDHQDVGEAAAVAEESSASTEQVSASTQQTSASTQQIAASAQELARTAEQLELLVGTFALA